MPAKRNDLRALRGLIFEADTLLSTTNLPDGRSQRAHELLTSAVALADELLAIKPTIKPAAILGAKGGKKTARRGSEYFAQIASMRKTRAGGRPRKRTE